MTSRRRGEQEEEGEQEGEQRGWRGAARGRQRMEPELAAEAQRRGEARRRSWDVERRRCHGGTAERTTDSQTVLSSDCGRRRCWRTFRDVFLPDLLAAHAWGSATDSI